MKSEQRGGIAVVIADDHAMVQAGLERIIDDEADMHVTGKAESGEHTLAVLADTPCDVILLDLTMPPPSGPELIRRIRAQWPGVAILVVSMHDEPRVVAAVLAAGAQGYVPKNSDPEILVHAVRRVAEGGRFIDSGLAHALLLAPSPVPKVRLSPRGREVLRRLADGQSNREIARVLFLSEKTVSTHKANLMAKLDFASMADLVRYADRYLAAEGTNAG